MSTQSSLLASARRPKFSRRLRTPWSGSFPRQESVHYLDDFLIVAHPASNQCRDDLRRLLDVFTHLRVPIAEDKLEGPTTSLWFLGIELDSDRMVLCLPQEKLSKLHILLARWRLWRYCQIGDLRSLVGKLQHASKVVRPGRTFLHRMFELLKGSRGRRPLIRLNAAFRSDLAWWHTFLEHALERHFDT